MAIPMITKGPNLQGAELYGLFPQEEKDTKFVLSDAVSDRLKRGAHAIYDSGDIKIRILTHTAKGALIGVIAGAGIGALVGIPGGPPGMLAGAGVGAAIGAGVGAVAGASYSLITLPRSKEYRDWKSEQMGKVQEVWANFIADLPVCPITTDVIRHPVKAQDGITYEAEAIIAWIQRAEQTANNAPPNQRDSILLGTSPLKICPITVQGLEYDMGYHTRLFNEIKSVYNGHVDNLVNANLAAFQHHVQTTRANIVTTINLALANSLQNNQISQAEFDDLSKENNRKLIIPKIIA